MNHFFSVLLYNIAFLSIALTTLFSVLVLFRILKKLYFDKWAYNKRDVPLSYNQVRIRRFACAFEINSTIIPTIAIFSILICTLKYTYHPFFALFFYAIALSSFSGSYDLGSLYKSEIEPSIRNCCLFLRPFELEHFSLSNTTRYKIYQHISGETCNYLSSHIAQVFSIGNPQGMVDHILHSVSLYASDEDWKKIVASLAEKAHVIVIHVGDTNGCIWELDLCSKQCFFDKVILIVDSPDKMDFLRRLDALASETILSKEFSGVSTLVYKDLNEGKWCCKSITDIQKADEEIEMIMLDYFSSRESMKSKHLLLDSNPNNPSLDNEELMGSHILSKSRVDKTWIHRLSFLLSPFGYCLANRWSGVPTMRLLISFGTPYLFLIIVGLFALGKIWSIIAYAILIIVLGYWVVICPHVTANENIDGSDTMPTILNIGLLKKTMFTFVTSLFILFLFTWLHSSGQNLIGL